MSYRSNIHLHELNELPIKYHILLKSNQIITHLTTLSYYYISHSNHFSDPINSLVTQYHIIIIYQNKIIQQSPCYKRIKY